MSAHNCKFCNKSGDIFTIEIPLENSDETYKQYICGTCWEVIAEITNRRTRGEILNLYTQVQMLQAQVRALLDALPSAKVSDDK